MHNSQQNFRLTPQQLAHRGVYTQDIERARILYQQHNQHRNMRLDPRYLAEQQSKMQEQEEDESDTESDDSETEPEKSSRSSRSTTETYQDISHMLLISSLDRNWIGNDPNETQYNFQIKFSPTSDGLISLPLYENNPTIPATITQANNGLRGDPNNSGWSLNGVTYQAYRADQPFGQIVGYEKIVEQGQKCVGLRNVYKNIVSIELVSFLTPGLKQPVDYHSSLTHLLISDPYYLVEIDEINNVYDGSSRDLSNAFSVVVPAASMYTSPNLIARHVEYKPVDDWFKKFYPSPLSSLTNMTIKVKTPLGKVLTNLNDTIDIKFVYNYSSDISDERNEVIVIQTSKFFSSNEYQPTDTILIKGYYHHNTSSPESQMFNDFMNRSEGHSILALSCSDDSLFLQNRIHIARPATLNINTGGLSELSWYTTYKNDEMDTVETIDSITTYDTGRLINLDMQNLYCFKITTREKNMNLLSAQSERV
uniref:Uncharacterized protein n=1 Tax=viral metagenome TaxID=1070528 RepID=A0A6C0E754_9ZZZZ